MHQQTLSCINTQSQHASSCWLRLDGSIRLPFASTIRTKSPTQVRLTLGLGNRGPGLVSNYFCTDFDVALRRIKRSNVQHHRAFPDFPRADRLSTRFADLALRGATAFPFLMLGL